MLRSSPNLTYTAVSINRNREERWFEVEARQYTSFYKKASSVRIRGHFTHPRYHKNQPVPAYNSIASVTSSVHGFDYDDASGFVLHVTVNSIDFFGIPAVPAAPSIECASPSTPRSSAFSYSYDLSSPVGRIIPTTPEGRMLKRRRI
jgi:hypothetical protein